MTHGPNPAVAALLAECKARGVRLVPTDDGRLNIDAPRDALKSDLLDQLKAHKPELLRLLAGQEPLGPPVHDPFDDRPATTEGLPCGHGKAWRSIYGPHLVCAVCHPPARPELVVEWIDFPALTDADRRAAYHEAVQEANRVYRGGPIDWPAVDAAYQRIVSAQTRAELRQGVRQYVNVVAGSHFSGKHC